MDKASSSNLSRSDHHYNVYKLVHIKCIKQQKCNTKTKYKLEKKII